MDNIKRSFFGYNKNDVRNLIFEKDQIIDTQKKDIDYLRKENENLNSKLGKNNSQSTQKQNPKDQPRPNNSSRFIDLEQEHLNQQMELQ